MYKADAIISVDDLINAATITEDPSQDQWREVISSVLFHAKPADLACLDELGSRFLQMGLVNAAHAWYVPSQCHGSLLLICISFLLSPLSPFLDTTPASYERGIMMTHNTRDEESTIFVEIAEYARSLVPVPKGQEQITVGLPQLLPYKLARAWRLAELGEVALAKR